MVKMRRKLLKLRLWLALALLLACILVSLNYFTGKQKHNIVLAKSKSKEAKFSKVPKITSKVAVSKQWTHKNNNDLKVPEYIRQAANSDEWISETITDSKPYCPSLLKNPMKEARSNVGCNIPNLNPFHPSMVHLIRRVPMPSCSRYKSYGKLQDGKLITEPEVVSATYRRVERKGDFNYVFGWRVIVPTTKQITDEFIEVDYLLKNGRHIRETFIQPVRHDNLVKRTAQEKPGIPLNVLIVGIDSLSHANAQRNLPELYEFLKKDLGAIIFNGHSIVGDGTTEQLAAMLTGQGELEQYESRRHHRNPRPVDGWSWIYKQLKEHGYLTGYAADSPSIGAFQLRLMGFKDPPTDFYPRPFYLMAEKLVRDRDKCLGSRTISKFQFDYIRDVFKTFPDKLKFFFSFNVFYSHNDNNQASMNEPDLISLLQDLKLNGHLNNTLLIVMGDHGTRFGKVRELMQGKLEERLPLFSITLPTWFKSKYPKIVENLRTNTIRLTSWYDVYATYRHMLSYPELPSNLKHGTSLFTEISTSRTCQDANVEAHWCPCLEWSPVSVNYSHVQNAALAAVEYMNTANQEHKNSAENCATLTLKTINYALLEKPNDKLLSFKETNDLLPAYSNKARPKHRDFCGYQLQFVTSPNNGIYEATVRYYKSWFMVSRSISRVDKYGDQPECIAKELPHLRKFCFCRNQL